MSSKTWMYVAAGAALVLIVGAVVVYLTTGDVVVSGGAGTAAAAAATEALRRRQHVREEVVEAKEQAKIAADRLKATKDKADEDMKNVAANVPNKTDDEKVADGNDLFS